MIISHKHKFVFVKTQKTAGTTIEVLLEPLAGEDAVVTPVGAPPVPGHRARNYETPGGALRTLVWRAKGLRHPHPDGDRAAYFNHISARGIRRQLGGRRWDSYFTFCFERNPWDKVVSGYFFAKGRGAFDGSFPEYVLTAPLHSDFDRYSLDGQTVGVDFVGRYERLEDDLRIALAKVGLGAVPVTLSREKGGYRPTGTAAETLYDDEMSARVERVFAREITALGYARPTQSARSTAEPAGDSR